MENVCMYGHLVYLTVIWSIFEMIWSVLWPFGTFPQPRFGTFHQEKSGNPEFASRRKRCPDTNSDLLRVAPEKGCQTVCFLTKNPNLGKFWRAFDWKMLIYLMPIWDILQTFRILYL
jgi:hypothetical protein